MASSDIAALFGGSPNDTKPVQIRQGIVKAWNPSTGDNTINVGGATLTNLAFLIAEATVLTAGDVVQLISQGGKSYILGKVTDPGESDIVPQWPGDIANLNDVVVPQIQADVVTAQGTADTAQSTATTAQGTADSAAADAAAAQAAADALQTALDDVAADVTTLTDTTLPALQSDLDGVAADVTTLTGTTLPALQSDVDDAVAEVATLAGTTIPALQSDLDDAAAAVVTAQAAADAAQATADGILPITETDISDDAITTPKIAANAVTANEIAANTITANEIAANAITTSELNAGAVTTAKISAGAVTAVEIAADTITAAQIAASAVTASELAANAVTAGKIAAGTIVAADISSGAITTAKLAADAVTANEIAAGTITATELAADAVTASKIQAGAIDGKTITGAMIRTAASGERVQIDSVDDNQVKFYSGDPSEVAPAMIETLTSNMWVIGPDMGAASGAATIRLEGNVLGDTRITFITDSLRFIDATLGGTGSDIITADSLPAKILAPIQGWTAPTLTNSWVDVAGSRAGYMKDGTGRVSLRGRVSGGSSAGSLAIFTLPSGFRPTQSMEWTMRSGVIICAVQVSTAGVLLVTANASTASSGGIVLDSISFPTT